MHINWQRNSSGNVKIINKGAIGTDGISSNNPSLTVEATSFIDVGVYHCSATNIVGTSSSDAIHLAVVGGKITIHFNSGLGS